MNNDKLILLGQMDPETANLVQEFDRLLSLTDNEGAKAYLSYMIAGMLSSVDQENNPWLVPYENLGEDAGVIKGYDDVRDIPFVEVDGVKYGVWHTNNFTYRLRFLMTGMIAVGYPVSVFAHSMHLDVTIQES